MKAVVFSVLGFLVNLGHVAGSEIYPSISWVPQNPLFAADGKTCSPGPRKLKVHLQSKVSFLCPNTGMVLQKSTVGVQTANMYENLWLLYSKTAFDECDVSLDPRRRLLLHCKSPATLQFFPVLFAQFTAEEDGLKFEGGRSYYFIGTSDGTESHLNDTHGGHCDDKNNGIYMKIAVYVCQKSNQTYEDPECASDVGVLQCPSIEVTPSTTTTRNKIPNKSDQQNMSLPEQGAQRGEDKQEGMWKAIAIAAIAGICLLLVVILLLLVILCGKKDKGYYCPCVEKSSHETALQEQTQRNEAL